MDPEIISMLSQLDAMINGLLMNPQISPGEQRSLQSSRAQLDRRVTDFKEEMAQKIKSFKSTMESQIKTLQQRALSLQSNSSR